MGKSGLFMDFTDFINGLKAYSHRVREAVEIGMGKAALQLMNDSVMLRPTVPHKEGTLRGSGSAFVNNKLVGTSSHGKSGEACTSFNETIKKDQIVAVVGFNTPYASRHHEVPAEFSEESAGNKYLESKMIRNKKVYYKIIANTIKEHLR